MKMLGFFCVVIRRRAVYEKVGELDEQFGVGYFEDTTTATASLRGATNCALPATPSCITGKALRSACWATDRSCRHLSRKPAPVRGQVGRRQHGRRLRSTSAERMDPGRPMEGREVSQQG